MDQSLIVLFDQEHAGEADQRAVVGRQDGAISYAIVGSPHLFGDPLGSDPPMIVTRLLAFILVVCAVALVPAPLRAQAALRANPSGAGAP